MAAPSLLLHRIGAIAEQGEGGRHREKRSHVPIGGWRPGDSGCELEHRALTSSDLVRSVPRATGVLGAPIGWTRACLARVRFGLCIALLVCVVEKRGISVIAGP